MLLLLLLLGCPSPPVDPDDADGDGVTDADDCASDDPDIFPGASDTCDGVDNDCDGSTDEDAAFQNYFRDQDGDGFGDPSQSLSACRPPDGYVKDSSDCGPSEPTIYPGALEYCDGADHDCDGRVNDEDAVDPSLWYPDQDHDGFGDPRIPPLSACVGPNGYVGNAEDCDDGSAAVSPRAPEVCDPDNVDENCNGLSDEADEFTAGAQQSFPDVDQDSFGDDHQTPTWICDLPPGFVYNDADCDDSRDDIHPSAEERCNGLDDNCDTITDTDAIDRSTWYRDRDEDSFGDSSVTIASCGPVTGYVAYGEDCDDHNHLYHPSADESDCGANDYNCDGFVGTEDHDGDGYSACLDCDDGQNAIHPSATETCDRLDNNCDGTVDADAIDATAWYADGDLDGYGDPSQRQLACEKPYLYVSSDGDCNDANPQIHPGVNESCLTPEDDNCDGDVNDPGALDCIPWYADDDGDAYGDRSDTTCTCSATVDYPSSNGDDCNDARADINPGAPEYCTTLDTDCDGLPGPCDVSAAESILDGIEGGGKFGDSVGIGDTQGDGSRDLVVGASAVTGLAAASGGVFVFDTLSSGRADVSTALALLQGEAAGDRAGEAVLITDLDQDGVDEVYVGAPGSSKVGNNCGVVYWVAGVTPGNTALTNATGGYVGELEDDQLGEHLAAVGDLNNDGDEEIAIGAVGSDRGSSASGAIYLMGPPTTTGLSGISAAPSLVQSSASEELSMPAAAGDVNGDGFPDLLVSAFQTNGNVWLMTGPISGVVDVNTATNLYSGAFTSYHLGSAMAAGGDQNADGYGDFWLGSPGSGTVYGLRGSATGTTSLTRAPVILQSSAANDDFGASLAGDSDLDGDGAPELLVGAPLATGAKVGAGKVYIFGSLTRGTWGTANALLNIPGEASDNLAQSLLGIPDWNADGQDEFAVTTPYHTKNGQTGSVYILFGNRLF